MLVVLGLVVDDVLVVEVVGQVLVELLQLLNLGGEVLVVEVGEQVHTLVVEVVGLVLVVLLQRTTRAVCKKH